MEDGEETMEDQHEAADDQAVPKRAYPTFRQDGSLHVSIPWRGRTAEIEKVLALRRRYEALKAEAAQRPPQFWWHLFRDVLAVHQDFSPVEPDMRGQDIYTLGPLGGPRGPVFYASSKEALGFLISYFGEIWELVRSFAQELEHARTAYLQALSDLLYGEAQPPRTPEELAAALEAAEEIMTRMGGAYEAAVRAMDRAQARGAELVSRSGDGAMRAIVGSYAEALAEKDSPLRDLGMANRRRRQAPEAI